MPDSGLVSSPHLQHISPSGVETSFSNIVIGNNSSQAANRSLTVVNNNNNPDNVNDQNNNSNSNDDVNERHEYFEEIRNGGGHWSHLLRQVILQPPNLDNRFPKEDSNGLVDESYNVIPLQILGGSENGQFAYIGHLNNDINVWIAVGYLQPGDVILEIQKQQIAGYTQADVLSLLYQCIRISSVTLTVAPRGSLSPELRSYLNTRFQKGSVDHALQGVVRDNLYLRTVPVTTRPPRPGEIPGVDYTFLSVEEFMELERNGHLLESGVYAGNHYGTPKPWASRPRNTNSQLNDGEGTQSGRENGKGVILPGMHPSSEGKRRRNRSNVEALGAADDEPPSPSINNSSYPAPIVSYSSRAQVSEEALGPLPDNWQMCFSEKNEVYFIDHNTGTSHWLDPRLSRIQKLALEDCDENELPFGWERIEDPHYGTYYIDHVNRRTQFENPVVQAKKSKSPVNVNSGPGNCNNENFQQQGKPSIQQNSTQLPSMNHNQQFSAGRRKTDDYDDQEMNSNSAIDNHPLSSMNSGLSVKNVERDRPSLRFFTRDPSQLLGERINTSLVKSTRGLGFTIVGGDDDDGLDEFLQIKSVVSEGPAWRDGKLRTGDVLVRVNSRCVLGYTHQEMVSMFQSIAPGEKVHLEVCRGYPLPFDPADPNTEIVTTVAVAPITSPENGDMRSTGWTGRPATPDSLAHSAHSLPELSVDSAGYGRSTTGRPASVDLLLDSSAHGRPEKTLSKYPIMEPSVFLTVNIIKGTAGFGFTIADSVAGQKVKKVLDRSHCGGLEEGDRLIAIDGTDLREMSHTQVVQVLKEFALGKEASLTIQRIQSSSAHNQKLAGVNQNMYSDSRLIPHRPGVSPRSKTPSAELGRGRPNIRDNLPERPKTPLLDSNGQINGQPSLYNGDVQQHDVMPLGHRLQFMPERYSTTSMGLENAAAPFSGTDLQQIPTGVRDWIDVTIDLQRRQEGFGFRIVGGTEEGSQVSVGHIVPGGAAALDGRLQTGDQIVAVDNVSVIGASHHSVVQLMAKAAAVHRVRLVVRKPIYGAISVPETVDSPAHSPSKLVPLHVTLRRQPAEGFGFVIISSAAKAGATIGRIVEGSPADRCGQLFVGDRILAVNQIDISQLHHSQVVQLIKDSGLVLTLSVISIGFSGNTNPGPASLPPSVQLSPSKLVAADLEKFSVKDQHNYNMGTAFISPESHSVHLPFSDSGSENMEQVFTVHLSRGGRGFGFSIRGGKEFQNMPLFVLRLAEDGPAAIDGRMQVGDQILQINGISTQGMTHAQAIHIIKTGGLNVYLLLRRGSVPFPFLSQMPNITTGGYGGSNGLEEEQSLSSNNDTQFVGQNSPMSRDHQQLSFAPPPE